MCSCKCRCTDVLGFDMSGDQLVFGIRWAPLDFVQQAVQVVHPTNIFTGISEEVRNAIHDVSSLHPAQIILRRKKWLHKWIGRVRDLEVEDKKMKSEASPERLVILNAKRLLKAIIVEEGYPDSGLADDIARGFDLVGKIPQSGTWPKNFSPSALTISDLHTAAPTARKALRLMARSSGVRGKT